MFTWIKELFEKDPKLILDNYWIVARKDSFVVRRSCSEYIFPNYIDVEQCKIENITVTIKDGKLSVFRMGTIKITGFYNPEAITLNKIRKKKD